jgi:hypothetical protein
VLYFLIFRAVNMNKTAKEKHNWWLPFILCFVYALLDKELDQFLTFNPKPNWDDIAFDTLGMSLAFLRIYKYI